MREVVFRNLTSSNSRKKDIFLQEVFEKDGVVAKTERRCLYFIRDVVHVERREDLQAWLDDKNTESGINRRQYYIFREHNDSYGKDRLLCKVLGTFYVVVDDNVFTIAFLHSFRAVFVKGTMAK